MERAPDGWTNYRRSSACRVVYIVILMAMMNFMSHGTRGVSTVPPAAAAVCPTTRRRRRMISTVGAILGGSSSAGIPADAAGADR